MSRGLRLSLALNVALAALVAALLWRDRSASPAAGAPLDARAPQPGSTESVSAGVDSAAKTRSADAAAKLTPEALAEVERLGIPREFLVSALMERFNRRWEKRLIELEKRFAPRKVPEREYLELVRLREAEQVRELKQALGDEGYRAWDKERTLRVLNSTGVPITEHEAERAYQLQKEFEQQHRELEMAMEDGVADRADGAALQTRAQQTLDRELEGLFGAQRLNQMRGLGDPIAQVQWRYGELNPTAAQAQAVLTSERNQSLAEAALAARLAAHPADTATVEAEVEALNATHEENLRRIFGYDAYENLRRQNDATFKTLQQYAAAWELKGAELDAAYNALHTMQERAARARAAAALRETAGQPVNWREVETTFEAARQQAEVELQAAIGPERLHRLKQNGLLTMRP